jgi:molybdopterin molybdotransferase
MSLLPLDEALAIIGKVARPVEGVETHALPYALNRVTAQPVKALRALPPYTNTGVDGYAFRHKGHGSFRLIGGSFAGQPFKGEVPEGCAVRIATGGMLPEGADTVAMQEVCTAEGEMVTIDPLPARGANIRQAGADIEKDAQALPAHHTLRPQDIALLGALGLTAVPVLRKIRVAIASTGQELVGHGVKLEPGQIVDTNSLMLAQLLTQDAVDVTMLDSLPDDYDATCAALQSAAASHDLVITTGGVSVGAKDYVRDVLHDVGRTHFWRLAIRPGKPVLLGQIGACLMLGLPGNPVSAFVTFFLMVKPLLTALNGQVAGLPPAFKVRITERIEKGHLRSFPRARLVWQEEEWCAHPYHDQSSNLFTSLTQADGVLDLAAEWEAFEAGEMVDFRAFRGML